MSKPSRRRLAGALAAVLGLAGLAVAVGFWRADRVRRDPGLSVLLISIDTLRADALGAYGNKRVKTPWIDRLAATGVRFETAHAHNVVTLPSHANILSGLLPLAHGVHDNTGFRFPPELQTLATRLKQRGFGTAAFVSAFVLDSRFGLDRGFDIYDDRTQGFEKQTAFTVPDRPGAETVALAADWIESRAGARFFCFVHLYDPHFPYAPTEPFATEFKDDPYLGEVSAVDRALGSLLSPILDGPLGQRTLVILTSDHGESLGEHGEMTHGTFAYEATLRVPLILHGPILSRRVVARPVRHIDLVPTVLDALALAAPDLPGRSLLPLAAGSEPVASPSYFESLSASLNQGWAPLRGWFDGRYKYIDLPIPELYDLASDPKETKNLAASEPETLERLRSSLARERASEKGTERRAEDAATLERMRALGYVAAEKGSPAKDRYTAADDPKNLIDLDRKNREVLSLHMAGRIDEAVALARENLSKRPDMAGVSLQVAYLERERGNLAAAIVAARRAMELKPLDAEAVSLAGAYLTEAGRPEEALRTLEPFARTAAPDFDVLTALGLAYSRAARVDEARAVFEKARALDPSSGMALVNIGTLELMLGRRDAARAALEAAVELDPNIARAHNTLGVMSAQEGRAEEAIQRWRRAVSLNPKDYQTLFNLGTTLDRVGRADEARPYFEAYLQTAPKALEAADIARVRSRLAASRR